MPDVEVRTAFGSDEGRLVVPADWAVLDVLRFEGPGAREVEDVAVRVREGDEVARSPSPKGGLTPLGVGGEVVRR